MCLKLPMKMCFKSTHKWMLFALWYSSLDQVFPVRFREGMLENEEVIVHSTCLIGKAEVSRPSTTPISSGLNLVYLWCPLGAPLVKEIGMKLPSGCCLPVEL